MIAESKRYILFQRSILSQLWNYLSILMLIVKYLPNLKVFKVLDFEGDFSRSIPLELNFLYRLLKLNSISLYNSNVSYNTSYKNQLVKSNS